ncbi:MAG: hypothetical protein HN548_09450 [Opitutae bacterium]|nr:hypothetical protein [Opitutae bacterium]
MFLTFFILSIFIFPCSIIAESKLPSVHNVRIPRFNDEGFVTWELHASKLSQNTDNTFQSIDPVLYLFSDLVLETTAISNSGNFLLDKGEARGSDFFEVTGNGFNAQGINWSWKSSVKEGENQMIFKDQANVVFSNGLNGFFADKTETGESNCSPDNLDSNLTFDEENLVPTIAHANYLEFLTLDKKTHRFLLDGNVSINGNNLFLTCEKIEVLFSRDSNSTITPIGEVSKMYAFDKVVLQQEGRTSYADRMTLDVHLGTALLLGNARVVDDEWGEASGEKIILEKGNRMAKVLARKNGRSRLELPPLPNLGFGRKSKKTIIK